MFSKELEALIQATLEDGILEDNEKAALVKRAQKEGVDLDELEIYIKSILQRREKEKHQKMNALEEEQELKKKEAIGPVCPKCGKQVPPLTLVCDCGYEFTNKAKVSSVQELSDKIEDILNAPIKYSKVDGKEPNELQKSQQKSTIMNERRQRVMDLIAMFPVPNTKEDIVEFLSLSAPKSIKKGGKMGTVMGRLSILVPVFIVFLLLLFILMPDTYVEDVSNGFFSTSTHQEVRQTEKGAIMAIVTFFGLPIIIGLAYLLDRNTLKWNKEADVWKAKFDQVMMKGRSLRGDADFQKQLDYYENMLVKK